MTKIQSDESQNMEYKEAWRDEYLKWICGFANAQGTKLDKKGKEVVNSTSEDETYTKLHAALRNAHKRLSEKIVPKVHEHGFLR